MKSIMLTLLVCAVNLVANSGFEEWVGSRPAGWQLPSTFSVMKGVGRNGSCGLVWSSGDASEYTLARARVALRPGYRYRLGGWVRPLKLVGENAFAGYYLDYYSKDGKYVGGVGSVGAEKVGEWQHVTLETRSLPEETAYGEVLAYASKGTVGSVAFDDLDLAETTIDSIENVWTSAYRDTATGGMVRVIAEINPAAAAFLPGASAVRTMSVPDGRGGWRALPLRHAKDFSDTMLNVSSLPLGKTPICFKVETNGLYVASKTVLFTRIAGPDRRRVRFDERNRTCVGGRPFFPVGMYAGALEKRDVDLLVGASFNCVMPYKSVAISREVMDYCAEKGLKVIYSIKDSYANRREYHPAEIVDDETEVAWIGEQVARWRDHPALLAWYICDEMEVSMVERLRRRRQLVAELDPDHPTWNVLYQASILRQYLGTYDVVGTDPYPIADLGQYPTAKDGIRRVTDWTRKTVSGTFGGARPIWMVPQCFDWACIRPTEAERLAAPSRMPTAEEVRNMTWQCLVGGAQGIVYYAYHELWRMSARMPFDKSFAIARAVAQELRKYSPYFLGEATEAIPTGSESVVGRRWTKGGRTLEVLVNASERSASATVEGRTTGFKPMQVIVRERSGK